MDISGVEDRIRDGRPKFGADLAQLRARVLASAVRRVPATVGRYRLGDTLGSGAFGTVYRGYDPQLGRPVAIKIVTVKSDAESARVVREARMLATLSNPHVVDVFEVGLTSSEPPLPYVVMELVPGQTLRSWFAGGRRSWRAVAGMVRQAALGLQAAHTAGIVHRDFKPDNALLGEDGRLRVLDFGLARPFGEGEETDPEGRTAGYPADSVYTYTPEITPAGHVMGTPAYMAPEAFYGEFPPAADQYSLGVVMYEGLFGRRPFTARSFEELRRQVTKGTANLPRDTGDVPRAVCRVVMRMLASDPAQRFASLQAMVDALDAARVPRRRPRRLAIAVGAFAFAGGLAWMHGGQAQCQSGATAYDAVRRDVVLPDAAAAAVDRHRAEWIDTEDELCAAEPELSWGARRCLQASLDATAHLVRAVEVGELGDEDQIDWAFERLPSPSACLTPDRSPVPSDAMKPAVVDLERRLVELWAIETTRHFDQRALAFAEKLATDAVEVGYAPLTAKAIRRYGKQLLLSGRIAEANTQFERSFFLAQDADVPVEAAHAATEVFRSHATVNRRDEAARWRAHAQAAFERAGIDPMSHPPFGDAEATLAIAHGDYEQAVQTLQQLLARLDAKGQGRSSVAADVTNRMGFAYYSMDEYDRAAEVFRRAMDLSRDLYGEQSARYAAAIDNLGLCLYGAGDIEGALERHLFALRIRENREPNALELGNSHGNLAIVYKALERYDEALVHLDAAMWRFEEHWGKESPQVGMLLKQRADVLSALGPSRREQAELDYQRALESFEVSGPAWVGQAQKVREALRALEGQAAPA